MNKPSYRHPEALVSTEWLAAHLSDPGLRIFDCTTYLIYETGTGRPYRVQSGRADYDSGHIPGAVFLDLQEELSDTSARTNFMMLPLDELARRFASKGIGEGIRVVLYSRKAMQWATRVWWMLRAVGFDNAAILDGGFDKWAAEKRAVSTAPRTYPAARFCARAWNRAVMPDGGACAGVCATGARSSARGAGASSSFSGLGSPNRKPWP